MIVPLAVAYDIVLEDHILPHQAAKRRARPFGREVAEMVRYAVGYQSRAFVTFGKPIPLGGYDPESRRDVIGLGHQIRDTIGTLYKVLPTAIVAAAMRPSTTRRELETRADAIIAAVARVERQPRRPERARGGRDRRADARRPQHHPRRARRPLPGPRAHRAALLRAHASSTCSVPRRTVRTH